jgi:FKBP-type peptidyl-prolyl cis-trans isomerase 2
MSLRMNPARAALAVAAALLVLGALSGCKPSIKDKTVVKISYTGTLADGTVFDSSEGGEPLEFVYGVGMMIPGLEKGLAGLKVGEKKTINVAAADAYGPRDESAVQEVPRDQLPKDMPLEIGQTMTAQTESGVMFVTIKELREKTVIMDMNHPMAGKDLTFAVEVMAIRPATKEELAQTQASPQ